jgi:hypothetical protein
MNQAQLERAVCRATGESRKLVHSMGFGLLVIPGTVKHQRSNQSHPKANRVLRRFLSRKRRTPSRPA